MHQFSFPDDYFISIKSTKDGSHTLYNEVLDETYHSAHGAIQEANHVFIKNGIQSFDQTEISVLEVGFGTGLNAILTYLYGKENKKIISYTGLESFPLSMELIHELNYINEIGVNAVVFNNLHKSVWKECIEIDTGFMLTKYDVKLQKFDTDEKFDVIYYDAFGPRAQKEMWEKSLFEKLYNMINPGGKLVTYCAMGQFKRDLKTCGYKVECIPGPPGKREMTVAHKVS